MLNLSVVLQKRTWLNSGDGTVLQTADILHICNFVYVPLGSIFSFMLQKWSGEVQAQHY